MVVKSAKLLFGFLMVGGGWFLMNHFLDPNYASQKEILSALWCISGVSSTLIGIGLLISTHGEDFQKGLFWFRIKERWHWPQYIYMLIGALFLAIGTGSVIGAIFVSRKYNGNFGFMAVTLTLTAPICVIGDKMADIYLKLRVYNYVGAVLVTAIVFVNAFVKNDDNIQQGYYFALVAAGGLGLGLYSFNHSRSAAFPASIMLTVSGVVQIVVALIVEIPVIVTGQMSDSVLVTIGIFGIVFGLTNFVMVGLFPAWINRTGLAAILLIPAIILTDYLEHRGDWDWIHFALSMGALAANMLCFCRTRLQKRSMEEPIIRELGNDSAI
mmetsp:Transcript_33664/g.38271  ORF Transcript_33664/g.38271 Transcript_33664/m.38271 type:complete len:326 (-) Transcript_33664:100-1077(-)